MDTDCPLLREIDAWFSLALDVLASQPEVRRDVLLLLGGPGRPEDVAHVTAADVEATGGYVFVYPPTAPHLALPLTPDFVEVAGLHAAAWPAHRADPAADAAAIEYAVAAVDAALARLTGTVRPTGPERLRVLRMHAWRHELGDSVGVLDRFYGPDLPALLRAAPTCPGARHADVTNLIPLQRQVTVVA